MSILIWSAPAVSPKIPTRDSPSGITALDLLPRVVDPTSPQPLGEQPPSLWPAQRWKHRGKGANGLVLRLVPAAWHWSKAGLES